MFLAIASLPCLAGNVTVQLGLKMDNTRNQELSAMFAIPVDAADGKLYQATQTIGEFYSLDVPAGTYDVVACFFSDNNQTNILLFYENQTFSENASMIVNTADAKLSTKIRHLTPDGEELVFPSRGVKGNCTTGDLWMMLRHNDLGTVFSDEMATLSNVMGTIATNVIPQHYSITRMDVLTWTESPVYYVMPIDMSKPVNEPTSDGWLTTSAEFGITPTYSRLCELNADEVPYTMAGYNVIADLNNYGSISMGVTSLPCNTHAIAYWTPSDYDGGYEFYPVLRSNLLTYAESSISSMPLRRTADGFVPIGRNFVGDGTLAFDSEKRFDTSNPRFSQMPKSAKLGNCTPALVCTPGRNGGFAFTYAGRFGEDMNIDAHNLVDDMSAARLKELGGQTHQVKVTCGDKVICPDADSFVGWLTWPKSGTVEAEISTHNVLIDNEVPGLNTATLAFDAAGGKVPTLTSLQIRDANDNPVDRISGKQEGWIELTAAVLDLKRGSGYNSIYYDYSRPSEVVVEFAPNGSSDFKELELEEMTDLFFMPGYGMCLRADIADLTSDNDRQWYDLRITVKGDDGSAQTQTISPALCVDKSGSGIESAIASPAKTDGMIYNLQGMRLGENMESLPAGVYIRNGKKFIIR